MGWDTQNWLTSDSFTCKHVIWKQHFLFRKSIYIPQAFLTSVSAVEVIESVSSVCVCVCLGLWDLRCTPLSRRSIHHGKRSFGQKNWALQGHGRYINTGVISYCIWLGMCRNGHIILFSPFMACDRVHRKGTSQIVIKFLWLIMFQGYIESYRSHKVFINMSLNRSWPERNAKLEDFQSENTK